MENFSCNINLCLFIYNDFNVVFHVEIANLFFKYSKKTSLSKARAGNYSAKFIFTILLPNMLR